MKSRVKRSINQAAPGSTGLAMPSLLASSGTAVVQAILGDERLRQRVLELEQSVQVTVDPRTRSGVRLKSMRGRIYEVPLDSLRPDETALSDSVEALRRTGLEIVRIGRFGVTVRGPARLVAEILAIPLSVSAISRPDATRATRMFSGAVDAPRPNDLFVAPRESLSIDGSRVHPAINDFVFIPPPLLLATAADAPSVGYLHADAAMLRKVMRMPAPADKNGGLTGKGVRVAMVDSGFDTSHPFYATRAFDFKAVSTNVAPNADKDSNGHGTAMAWNILAMASECQLRGYRYDEPGSAMEDAATGGASVISCSWGYDREQVFPQIETSIRSVIEDDGAIVLFAAGNGQQCWPACMPSVIAVGGVYANPKTLDLEASDFASGFRSNLYLQRMVPDVSGLCGSSPYGIYFPLPVPAGCEMDQSLGGKPFPDKDETKTDDGWVYARGTSSATPQVAGIVALMVQHARSKGKSLTLTQARDCLMKSAQAVEKGRNAFGFPAVGNPNVAVGWGLVDVGAALHQVDLL